jgi:CMP-N-acetylneuraminic acid synthetase/regulator of RNase E activity RraA
MKVVAIVPAKSSSERVLNKNTRPFNGEPLFVYTVRKLLSCDFIDEVYVDSDCDDILKRAVAVGANAMKRDPRLATNKTDGHELFLNEVSNIESDIYIQHLCTSPFVQVETIRSGVEMLRNNLQHDSVVLCRSEKYYHWKNGAPAYSLERIPNSTDLPAEISEAMSLYIMRRDAAFKLRRRIGETPHLLFGNPTELIDVNTEEDLKLAEMVVKGKAAEERSRFRILSNILTTALVSDVCDSFGLNCLIQKRLVPNFRNAKMIGRARTLHLRPVESSDSPNAIYDALKSYVHVFENDVIVVQNDCEDLAYFGELNMNLAIRSGAVGAVIGGVTRDSLATTSMSFPTFSAGFSAKDIKTKGAVASINEPVRLFGVTVSPSDVIFADREGVLVLPYWKADAILNESLKIASNEKTILHDIANGRSVQGLLGDYGAF